MVVTCLIRCNQRLLEGQSQVEELQKSLQENSSKAEDVVLMKRKCQEHLEKLRDATEELKKKSRTIEELENKHSSSGESESAELGLTDSCDSILVPVLI
ncbi:hypothetical protein DNTS_005227 [Danionella cerebrum]|uniref:Hook C-terminal domain-containing protein n=1 Tax=Danionella cerebrum TaxID=2873325 RepID=A0A553QDA8_9TELE|nr:hypothetical protein DNTS_005227 [Danionella translucida]